MILLSRVSRAKEELQATRSTEIYFKIEVDSTIHHIPVILGAFVPGLLESVSSKTGPVHYIEKTWKGKGLKEDVLHVHEMLPSSASLLSVPHAICLVARFMTMYSHGYISTGKLFEGNMKRSPFKFGGKEDRAVEKRLYRGGVSLNDFSAYGPRYNSANLLHNVFGLVFDSDKTEGNLHQNVKNSEYLKKYQFGHTDESNQVEDTYATNVLRLKGAVSRQKSTDSSQQTEPSRQKSADSRQKSTDSSQKSTDSSQKPEASSKKSADSSQQTLITLSLEYEDSSTQLSKGKDEEKKKMQKMIAFKREKAEGQIGIGICHILDGRILDETLMKHEYFKANQVEALLKPYVHLSEKEKEDLQLQSVLQVMAMANNLMATHFPNHVPGTTSPFTGPVPGPGPSPFTGPGPGTDPGPGTGAATVCKTASPRLPLDEISIKIRSSVGAGEVSLLEHLRPLVPKLDVSRTYLDLTTIPGSWAAVMMDDIAKLNSMNFAGADVEAEDENFGEACKRALDACGPDATFATRDNCTMDLSHIGRVLFFTGESA